MIILGMTNLYALYLLKKVHYDPFQASVSALFTQSDGGIC